MATIPQIKDLGKDLQQAKDKYNVPRMIKVLENLGKCDITTGILRETQIGKIVNRVKKSQTNTQIKQKSEQLINKWKEIVSKEKAAIKEAKNNLKKQNNSDNNNSNSNTKTKSNNNSNNNDNESKTSDNENENNNNNNNNTKYEEDASAIVSERPEMEWETGVSFRDKVRGKLIEALKPEIDYVYYRHYVELAMDIEKLMFVEISQKMSKRDYLSKFRDIQFAFRTNDVLKLNLLQKQVNNNDLIRMSSQELANQKLKTQRSETKKWRLEEARSDNKKLAQMTDEFKCGKCGSRKVKYSQAQTRSADEPMTTFFACIDCGNKWKMG